MCIIKQTEFTHKLPMPRFKTLNFLSAKRLFTSLELKQGFRCLGNYITATSESYLFKQNYVILQSFTNLVNPHFTLRERNSFFFFFLINVLFHNFDVNFNKKKKRQGVNLNKMFKQIARCSLRTGYLPRNKITSITMNMLKYKLA